MQITYSIKNIPMKTDEKLGIWMDNSIAHIIEFTTTAFEKETVETDFTHQDKAEVLARSEASMHNKEQQLQADFYKKLETIILNYDTVVLFGSSNAKKELFNILNEDNRFADKKIELKPADKMTDKQRLAFVSDYFETVKT